MIDMRTFHIHSSIALTIDNINGNRISTIIGSPIYIDDNNIMTLKYPSHQYSPTIKRICERIGILR